MLTRPFETENKQTENKNRAAGVIVTVTVHALLFLLLYFLFITPPDPPYEDNAGGMAVNYGTSDVGSGEQQQYTAVPVKVQEVQEKAPTPQPTATSAPEDLETQDKEDAAVVEKKTEVKKTKVKPNPDATYKPTPKPAAVQPVAAPQPTVDKNALFSAGAQGKPNNSKGDGEGKGKGDQGDPNGDPNSKNYHGGGNGTGGKGGEGNGPGGYGTGNGPPSNVRLTGRSLRSRPPIKNPCETARGRVTISISVNRSGHVTNSKFSQSGSTTSDDCLVSTARQAAMKYVFDENSSAAETQTGSILFIFKED
jgi:outer membrane biosynthesis protein TonB